eukprot:jgi/Botrbrau1/11721/Bobra.0195s0048.2
MAIPWDTTWRYVMVISSIFVISCAVMWCYKRIMMIVRGRTQPNPMAVPGTLYTNSGRPFVVVQQPISASQQYPIIPGRDSVLVLSPQWAMQGQRRPDAQHTHALHPQLVDRIPSFVLPPLEEDGNDPKLELERECVVCQEDFGSARLMRLPCFHIFHKACVRPWLLEHATCPTCRLPITQELLRGDIIIPMEEGADSQPSAPIERGLPSGPQPGGAAPFLRPTSQNSFQVALPPPAFAERSHRSQRGSDRVVSWAVQGSGAQEPRVPEAPRP